MAVEKNLPADLVAREIGTTRTVSATPAPLGAAFNDHHRLTQWWTPKGFTSTFQAFDFPSGGRRRLFLRAPRGNDYENVNEFIEGPNPSRLVLRNRHVIHGFVTTIGFTAHNGGTRATWKLLFKSADESTKVREFVTPANAENLERLEPHVRTHS